MQKITLILSLILTLLPTYRVLGQEIANLYKNVKPSVVTILTQSRSLNNNYQTTIDSGLGSGVLISNSGEILTAAHVVNNAETIEVKFLNGDIIPAKVVRSAPTADIAIIKISLMPKTYKVANLGDSDTVAIGEKIIVVGAPFGLEHSLSVGYISQKAEKKNQTSGFVINEYFQTDASINQGNSGGPMFNLNGNIIGISSYIITKSGGFEGLGFAVTSNLAQQLVVDGNRKWTGIQGYLLDERTAAMLNVPGSAGILIESVVKYSPADMAGLKGGFQNIMINNETIIAGGDIILSINGFPISKTLKDLDFLNTNTYELEILRKGKIEAITIQF